MSKKARMPMQSDNADYHKGYLDGRRSAFDDSELDAYYAGVGYGKKSKSMKHIGFTSDEERKQFEAGVSNAGLHFRAYRAEPPSFWERLFFGRSIRREAAFGERKESRQKKWVKKVSLMRDLKKKSPKYVKKINDRRAARKKKKSRR